MVSPILLNLIDRMKLQSRYILLLPLVILFACSKNTDIFTPENSEQDYNGNINNFYHLVRKNIPAEEFIINSSVENVITSHTGVRFIIPTNAFSDSLQNNINGEIRIKIIQLSTKSDFIRYAQFSNNSNLLLDWYKNINIEAYQNGKKLSLLEGKSISIQIPSTSPSPNWKIFNGVYLSTRKFKIAPSVFSQIKSAVWKDGGSGSIVEGIEFNSNLLNWICIASPVGDVLFTAVNVKLPVTFRSFNTMVVAVNKSNKVIYGFEDTMELQSLFSQKIHDLNDLTFFVASDYSNNVFIAEKFFESIDINQEVNLTPLKVTLEDLEKSLNKL